MSLADLEKLYHEMRAGNQEAAEQLDVYLRTRAAKALGGITFAEAEVETLIYNISRTLVEKRIRRHFPFLIDRHSVGSVLHPAWLRVLGASSPPIDSLNSLVSLAGRIGTMINFACLDIVKAQRAWDRLHHDPKGRCGSDSSVAEHGINQKDDGGQNDPCRLAQIAEFHASASALPDEERQVFSLAYYAGMPRNEIARRLGVTEHRVRVLMRNAKEQVGKAILDLR
jgi:RNA polymerase sigma factor (sigma-70 family)